MNRKKALVRTIVGGYAVAIPVCLVVSEEEGLLKANSRSGVAASVAVISVLSLPSLVYGLVYKAVQGIWNLVRS
jgi:putative exporter of polyketide antibiotics